MIHHGSPLSGVDAGLRGLIATAGYDNQIILWDGERRAAIARACHDHLANQCRFGARGDVLLSASSDYTARLWEVPTLRLLAVYGDHTDDVEMAAFDPAGERVATASRDRRVRIFARDGRLQRTLEGHEADVLSVVWTRGGREICSSSDDGTVRRWSAETGALLETIDLAGVETDTIVMDGDDTIYAGDDHGEIVHIHGGRATPMKAHDAGIKRLVIDPAGRRLLSTSYDRRIKIWRIGPGGGLTLAREAVAPPVIWARSGAFMPDGRIVLGTFGTSYAVYAPADDTWDLDGVEGTPGLNHALWDGRSIHSVGDAGEVRRDGAPAASLGSLCNFLVSFRGRILAGGHTGQLLDVATGAALHQHRSPLNCAVVVSTRGGEELIVGTYTGEGLSFQEDGEAGLRLVATLPLHTQAVKGLAASREQIFSVSASGEAALHRVEDKQLVARLPDAHARIANGVAAVPDGRFATVSRDRMLRIWEGDVATVIPTPHEHSIKCVQVSASGRLVATGGYDGTIALFDLERRVVRRVVRPTCAGISSIARSWDPDGFIASSYDGRTYPVAGADLVSPGGGPDGIVPGAAAPRVDPALGVGAADVFWMQRCLALASRGEGHVWPNPLVGCVIVLGDRVLAEGWHSGPGLPHAEADALARLGGSAPGATLYVNLEPCCHHGRTPPCTDAILRAGIQRVVAGVQDPNPRVDGHGIEILRAAGIDVLVGVEAEACRQQNEAFFCWVQAGCPSAPDRASPRDRAA